VNSSKFSTEEVLFNLTQRDLIEATAREPVLIGVEMSSEHTTARMQAAPESQSPANALFALARALKAEGMSQREMLQLFDL
jgi:hypothetical protein